MKKPLSEELVGLIQAISEDQKLRDWFLGLKQLPDSVRRSALAQMAVQMQMEGEDDALISVLGELAERDVYEAACHAIRDPDGA